MIQIRAILIEIGVILIAIGAIQIKIEAISIQIGAILIEIGTNSSAITPKQIAIRAIPIHFAIIRAGIAQAVFGKIVATNARGAVFTLWKQRK